MTEVNEDKRTLTLNDVVYNVADMSEESQKIYNSVAVIEQMLKKNQSLIGEISLLIDGLMLKRRDLLLRLENEEPLISASKEQDKEEDSAKKESSKDKS